MTGGRQPYGKGQMFNDERARELMDQVMALVCPTFFDTGSSFQCSGSWPSGKDSAWFDIRVYPSVVELVGGKHDGETVYQGFRVDLRALQVLPSSIVGDSCRSLEHGPRRPWMFEHDEHKEDLAASRQREDLSERQRLVG